MPISNVSTLLQRINSGSEGGLGFARFMTLLLIAKCDLDAAVLHAFSDQRSDYKEVDTIINGKEM